MDIRQSARRQLIETSGTPEGSELARAVLEMVAALQRISSVPTNSHEPMQGMCATIAATTLEKWTGENWVGGAGGFNAPQQCFPNRSPSPADKGG